MSETKIGLGAMSPEVKDYFLRFLDDLKLETGLTMWCLSGSDSLMYLERYFGVTTAKEGYELLRTALAALDSSQLHVQALLSAYGGEGLAYNLRERRWDFAHKHGLVDTRVIELERQGINELAEKLDALVRGEITPPPPELSVQELLAALLANGLEIKELLVRISAQLSYKH